MATSTAVIFPHHRKIRRVLLVDDYDDGRLALALWLKARGVETYQARDGREAVELAVQRLPEIVLMDLSMPILDGYGATRQIKLIETTRYIPILAVSANCHFEKDCEAALEAGCCDCLSKPIDLDELANILNIN